MEVEFEAPSVSVFHDLVRELRNILSNELREYDYTIIKKEAKLNYFPSKII
jgi:hypothetical protein